MSGNYIAALIAFLGGSVISMINAFITAKQVNSESHQITTASSIRQILSFAYLVGTYFVARRLPVDLYWPLIGAAVGLTAPAILFAFTIAKKMKGDD